VLNTDRVTEPGLKSKGKMISLLSIILTLVYILHILPVVF